MLGPGWGRGTRRSGGQRRAGTRGAPTDDPGGGAAIGAGGGHAGAPGLHLAPPRAGTRPRSGERGCRAAQGRPSALGGHLERPPGAAPGHGRLLPLPRAHGAAQNGFWIFQKCLAECENVKRLQLWRPYITGSQSSSALASVRAGCPDDNGGCQSPQRLGRRLSPPGHDLPARGSFTDSCPKDASPPTPAHRLDGGTLFLKPPGNTGRCE